MGTFFFKIINYLIKQPACYNNKLGPPTGTHCGGHTMMCICDVIMI